MTTLAPVAEAKNTKEKKGREPWSSGYVRRLMFQRSWVPIPAPYTGWSFSHIFVVKIVMMFFKRQKINNKIGRGWPIFKKNVKEKSLSYLLHFKEHFFPLKSFVGEARTHLWFVSSSS